LTPLVHFFGDSFVAGFGDPSGQGWVGRVALKGSENGWPFEVANHGVPGETSAQAVARWFNTLVEPAAVRQRDERAVFSFGTNDVIVGMSQEESVASLRAALDLAKSLEVPALVIGPPPVGDLPEADAMLAQVSAAFAELAAVHEVPFVATHAVLSEPGPWREEAAASDGSHPTGGGYAVLAGLIEAGGFADWISASR
jgi:acyl-CoA thioesterase-1